MNKFMEKINDYLVVKLLTIKPKSPKVATLKENPVKYSYKLKNGMNINIGANRTTGIVFLDFHDDVKLWDILGIKDIFKLSSLFNTLFYTTKNYNIKMKELHFVSIDERRINLYMNILRRNFPLKEITVEKSGCQVKFLIK